MTARHVARDPAAHARTLSNGRVAALAAELRQHWEQTAATRQEKENGDVKLKREAQRQRKAARRERRRANRDRTN